MGVVTAGTFQSSGGIGPTWGSAEGSIGTQAVTRRPQVVPGSVPADRITYPIRPIVQIVFKQKYKITRTSFGRWGKRVRAQNTSRIQGMTIQAEVTCGATLQQSISRVLVPRVDRHSLLAVVHDVAGRTRGYPTFMETGPGHQRAKRHPSRHKKKTDHKKLR